MSHTRVHKYGKKLNTLAKILRKICKLHSKKGCFMSLAKMAPDIGISLRTLKSGMKDAKLLNLIFIKKRLSKNRAWYVPSPELRLWYQKGGKEGDLFKLLGFQEKSGNLHDETGNLHDSLNLDFNIVKEGVPPKVEEKRAPSGRPFGHCFANAKSGREAIDAYFAIMEPVVDPYLLSQTKAAVYAVRGPIWNARGYITKVFQDYEKASFARRKAFSRSYS